MTLFDDLKTLRNLIAQCLDEREQDALARLQGRMISTISILEDVDTGEVSMEQAAFKLGRVWHDGS